MKKKLLFSILCCVVSLGVITGCGNNSTNLLNNPKDEDVKNALEKIEGVKSTCIVTEDNDPNGNLNKDGGYTGAVYFRLTQVDENIEKDEYSTPYEEDACQAGTSGGGQIEIYANEEDAKSRNDYLSGFDGTILADFHSIRGTVIIRLSNELTASQQEELEEKIYNILNETQPK